MVRRKEITFDFQVLIWGAAWSDTGGAGETDAWLAEFGHAPWDSGHEYLDSVELHVEGRKVETPPYWALPAVADLLILDESLAEETLSRE